MIKGITLLDETRPTELAQLLQATQTAKKDYIMDTRVLTIVPKGRTMVAVFKQNGEEVQLPINDYALQQICSTIELPWVYAKKLREHTREPKLFEASAAQEITGPAFLADTINWWFQNSPLKRMLRTYRGLGAADTVRAFLSDKFRPLDNFDLAEAVLPTLLRQGVEIKSCEVTETRLYIQAVTPRITATIPKVGDTVQAGLVISNSEVGAGSIRVEPMVYTLRCTNGMISGFALKQHHVGRRNGGGGNGGGGFEEASEFFSDATREQDDKALWMKVRDVASAALDHVLFDRLVEKLRLSTEIDLTGHATTVQEVVAKRFGFTEEESGGFLNHLAAGGDMSQYGIVGAITRLAQDSKSYDRAIELERFGGQALELARHDFLKPN